jgi:8-oxo-dGTP pyrophosphatase MutT (NUDIX family)
VRAYLCHVLNQLAASLALRLAAPLPGREAQFRMASSFRIPPGYTPDMSQARVGGVLIALYPDNGIIRTVLMKRPDYIGTHSGQVSFPGGKKEPNDPDITATALREAQEEVAISPQDVKVLGQLTELYIPASNFLVHPVIGLLDHVPHLIPDAHEVERILLPNLHHFFRNDIVGEKFIPIRENLTVKAPFYDVEGHTVWGATAMILSEFIQVLSDIGFSGQDRP